jgi:hypothetical protein
MGVSNNCRNTDTNEINAENGYQITSLTGRFKMTLQYQVRELFQQRKGTEAHLTQINMELMVKF